MGLTSYEETVANLQQAYETIRKTVDWGREITPDEAFQCECAIKDALSLLEEQDTVPPSHKSTGELFSLIEDWHIFCPWCGKKIGPHIFCPWCGRKVRRDETD